MKVIVLVTGLWYKYVLYSLLSWFFLQSISTNHGRDATDSRQPPHRAFLYA